MYKLTKTKLFYKIFFIYIKNDNKKQTKKTKKLLENSTKMQKK